MLYKVHVTLPESKIFFRDYVVKAEMNLFAFHAFLANQYGFDPDQMVYFESRDAAGARQGRYCLFDLGDGAMDAVTFADLSAREAAEIRYIFEMHTHRYLIITIVGEADFNPREAYPALLDGKGDNPDQFNRYVDPEPYVVIKPSRPAASDEDDEDEDFDEDDDEEENDGDEDGQLLVDEDFGKED